MIEQQSQYAGYIPPPAFCGKKIRHGSYFVKFNQGVISSRKWWVAIGAGILTLLLALVTIGYHSVEIAKVNPSSTLRNQ